MKRIYPILLAGIILLLTGCHKNLWNDINDLKSRVQALEEKCNTMNTNITALQVLINAQSSGDMISNVSEVTYGGAVIGYTITFTSGKTITLYNGKDGAAGQNGTDGQDGYTPSIGVAQDTDGIYYWTVDSQWLTDANGNKIAVTSGKGDKGEKGDAGQDGTNGADGADGKTPQLKIEDGYWYLSYDGTNWTKLGKATGEDGKDGTNGTNGTDGAKGDKGDTGEKGDKGDNIFSSVTQDADYVYFTLADGNVIKIAKNGNSSEEDHADSDIIEFKDLNVKAGLLSYTPSIDTNEDGEISYGEAKAVKRLLMTNNNYLKTATSFKELKYFENLTYFWSNDNLFEYSFPERLDTIGKCCSDAVNHINIPKGCKCIMDNAFSADTNTKVNFPKDSELEYLGKNLKITLTDGTLPNTIKHIGAGALAGGHIIYLPTNLLGDVITYSSYDTIVWNCANWTQAYLIEDIYNYYNGYGLGGYYYYTVYGSPRGYMNETISCVKFGHDISKIPDYLCYGLSGLTHIDLPENLTEIGKGAFGNTCLKEITIGEKVTTIGAGAFDPGHNMSYNNRHQLERMYCKAIQPPILGTNAIDTLIDVIYVPRQSVDDYRIIWSNYAKKIVGYDFE